MTPLLTVEGLSLGYRGRAGLTPVLHAVSFSLGAQQTLGIVGESGSGKSQIALALTGLLPAHAALSGQVQFDGRDLLALSPRQRRALRGARIGLIFQDPMTSLNPHLTIGLQLAEVLERHRGASRRQALAESRQMLDAVRIPDAARRLAQYPHELSGGQRQRVMIAMMLLARPALLIADEPTTALDVTVQAGILDLLTELKRELRLSLVMISHDLGVMADVADEILVLYAGRVMEYGAAATVLGTPGHPYTQALLACRARLDTPWDVPLASIPGAAARAAVATTGCVFAPRCARVESLCLGLTPELHGRAARQVACHFA